MTQAVRRAGHFDIGFRRKMRAPQIARLLEHARQVMTVQPVEIIFAPLLRQVVPRHPDAAIDAVHTKLPELISL